MGSQFFLWIETNPEDSKGELIEDPVTAVRKFLEAVETKEHATLRWSS